MSSSRRSGAIRPDGRVRLRADVPISVVELADRLAGATGADREAILGDLAAVGLPEVLADLARTAVADSAARRLRAVPVGQYEANVSLHKTDPELKQLGAVSESVATTSTPTVIIAVPATKPEPDDGCA